MDFRKYIDHLDEKGELIKITKKVNVDFEIASIMKILDGKPLLFENIEGFDMPVAANILSSRSLLAAGLNLTEQNLINKMSQAISNPIPPEIKIEAHYDTIDGIESIPILYHYDFDGGKYISSAVVIAYDDEYGFNTSYHRMMLIGDGKIVLRILPRDFKKYIDRGLKEFAICIGNPISLSIASAISMSTDVNELDIANALSPFSMVELDGFKVPESEIVIIAELTGELHDEGPFLDLTETPDIIRKQPVAKIKKIFVKPQPIYHALLPGGLEHKILMGTPKEPTIFHEVEKVCKVKDVYITPGGCSWLHAVVSIIKQHKDDGKKAIEAAFKGHKSLKHVFIVDDDIDITDSSQIEWAMATRFQGSTDMVLKNDKGSSLDPSADPVSRETTKIGFDLTIPFDKNRNHFLRPSLPMDINIHDYI